MGNTEPSNANTAPEAQKTECLSASATLFWRVFVPIFGTVFLSGLTLALMLIDEENLYLSFPAWWARIAAVLMLGAWVLLIKRTIWRLKRVDADDTYLYVTNFWQTARYPWTDVAEISETKRAGRRIVHFQLVSSGRFGQVISFLPASHLEQQLTVFGILPA
jgi:hypothetical protein